MSPSASTFDRVVLETRQTAEAPVQRLPDDFYLTFYQLMNIIESGRHFSMMFPGDLKKPTTVTIAFDNRYGTPKDTKFEFIFHTDKNVRHTLMKLDSMYW